MKFISGKIGKYEHVSEVNYFNNVKQFCLVVISIVYNNHIYPDIVISMMNFILELELGSHI